ncbi:MAG: photosystem II reaction center protein Psb28, partial [Prochlorothrix sp.]
PRALSEELQQDILGMFLIDDEGELVSRQVNGKFINGQAKGIEATYVMKSPEQWERFMRFMERYAKAHGLGFTKS